MRWLKSQTHHLNSGRRPLTIHSASANHQNYDEENSKVHNILLYTPHSFSFDEDLKSLQNGLL